jgi:hypothetical protein
MYKGICALLRYNAASSGNSLRRFGTKYRSHLQGSRSSRTLLLGYRNTHYFPRHHIELTGQIHVPAALHPRKEHPDPINGQLLWKPGPVWSLLENRNICIPAGKRVIISHSSARSLVTTLTEPYQCINLTVKADRRSGFIGRMIIEKKTGILRLTHR